MTLTNSLFQNNHVVTGTAGITNTILASHTVGINNTGAAVFEDYNLFFGNGIDVQGQVSGGANSLVGDPLFLAPATGDYHLLAASPAVDGGVATGVTSDYDGDARPLGAGYDIGFDEVVPAPGTPTPTAAPTVIPGPSPTAEPRATPPPTATAIPTPPVYTTYLPVIR